MPRPARFDSEAILAAALRVVGAYGPRRVTVEAVAAEMGGHVGSLYYRFPTKDHLFAQLWMRCAGDGQAGLLAALDQDDLDRALDRAVLHYPRWSRTEIAAAQVLAHGREQLVPNWPDDLADQLATVNDDLIRAVADFTRRWFGDARAEHRRAMSLALLDLPSSAIRRYLVVGKPPPVGLDRSILAGARAILAAAA
ncbi:MAG: TetR/AcrR family transcriptional regulator [Dehalococcoidia bacterium]